MCGERHSITSTYFNQITHKTQQQRSRSAIKHVNSYINILLCTSQSLCIISPHKHHSQAASGLYNEYEYTGIPHHTHHFPMSEQEMRNNTWELSLTNFGSYRNTRGTYADAHSPCFVNAKCSKCILRIDSLKAGTARMYGSDCFTTKLPLGPVTINTRFRLPSPT